jgi:hypothetical protein
MHGVWAVTAIAEAATEVVCVLQKLQPLQHGKEATTHVCPLGLLHLQQPLFNSSWKKLSV